MGERRENEREGGVAHAGTHGLGVTEAKERIMDDPDKDSDEDLKDVTPLKEYFEHIRQAYGIELVGTVELGDMWNETDGKEDHGRQSRDEEDDYDAG